MKQKHLNELYVLLAQEIGASSMELVHEIVELELLLEAESNK